MTTVVTVADRAELLAHIKTLFSDFGPDFDDNHLYLEPYCDEDARIGWKNVHIVHIADYGPVGFTDCPEPKEESC